jgi:hypothetical protein
MKFYFKETCHCDDKIELFNNERGKTTDLVVAIAFVNVPYCDPAKYKNWKM